MKNLLLIAFLIASPLMASDADVTWQQTGSAATWSVYAGITSGVYGAPVTGLLSMSYSFPDGALAQDMRNYVAVTGSNQSGESGFSNEVNGFPRPIISTALPVQDAGFIRMTVTGSNFSDDLTTASTTIVGMTILAVNRVSATQVTIDYTVDPGTIGDADLIISNDWTGGIVASVASQVFIVPSLVPLPPMIVDVN